MQDGKTYKTVFLDLVYKYFIIMVEVILQWNLPLDFNRSEIVNYTKHCSNSNIWKLVNSNINLTNIHLNYYQ